MTFDLYAMTSRADGLMRYVVLYGALAACMMADTVSFNIPIFADVRPSFTLMGLFYWTIYRPTIIPVWLAFAGGIALDVMSGFPLGLNAFFFTVVLFILGDQRRIFLRQSFMTVYMGFALVMCGYYAGQWLIFSAVSGMYLPYDMIGGAVILNLLFFPLVALMMNLCHKILPVRSQDIIRSSFRNSAKIR